MNNNQVMNFNNKLSSALVSCSASDVLNNVEQRNISKYLHEFF